MAELRKWLKRLSWPYLDLYLDLWLFRIQTQVNFERMETLTTEYVVLRIELFRLWSTHFRLYTTYERQMRRSGGESIGKEE